MRLMERAASRQGTDQGSQKECGARETVGSAYVLCFLPTTASARATAVRRACAEVGILLKMLRVKPECGQEPRLSP